MKTLILSENGVDFFIAFPPYEEHIIDTMLSIEDFGFSFDLPSVLVYRGDRLVGITLYSVPGDWLNISHGWVVEDEQKKGIYTVVHEILEVIAKQLGLKSIRSIVDYDNEIMLKHVMPKFGKKILFYTTEKLLDKEP